MLEKALAAGDQDSSGSLRTNVIFSRLTLEIAPEFILVHMAAATHIGKAAKLAGVSADTIRLYQKLALIDGGNRSAGGYRLFSEGQIHNLKFVRHAQELGFSLDEVKELLALRQKPHNTVLHLLQAGTNQAAVEK